MPVLGNLSKSCPQAVSLFRSDRGIGVGVVEEVDRLTSRPDAQPAEGIPDVCTNRVHREHEQLGDLVCSQPFAIEPEDCQLARSQPVDKGSCGLLFLCARARQLERTVSK